MVAGTSDVFKADLALATMPLLIEDLTWKETRKKSFQIILPSDVDISYGKCKLLLKKKKKSTALLSTASAKGGRQ